MWHFLRRCKQRGIQAMFFMTSCATERGAVTTRLHFYINKNFQTQGTSPEEEMTHIHIPHLFRSDSRTSDGQTDDWGGEGAGLFKARHNRSHARREWSKEERRYDHRPARKQYFQLDLQEKG
jgi:hypothetical protein